jgi:hypothetical protein
MLAMPLGLAGSARGDDPVLVLIEQRPRGPSRRRRARPGSILEVGSKMTRIARLPLRRERQRDRNGLRQRVDVANGALMLGVGFCLVWRA